MRDKSLLDMLDAPVMESQDSGKIAFLFQKTTKTEDRAEEEGDAEGGPDDEHE